MSVAAGCSATGKPAAFFVSGQQPFRRLVKE
jgi:hypothetical protein